MALIFEVKVIPSAGRFAFLRDKNGTFKCFLKSAPEKGDANRELIKELAKLLKLSQQEIEIIAGLTSRKKKLKIYTQLTEEGLCKVLGVSYQNTYL